MSIAYEENYQKINHLGCRHNTDIADTFFGDVI